MPRQKSQGRTALHVLQIYLSQSGWPTMLDSSASRVSPPEDNPNVHLPVREPCHESVAGPRAAEVQIHFAMQCPPPVPSGGVDCFSCGQSPTKPVSRLVR